MRASYTGCLVSDDGLVAGETYSNVALMTPYRWYGNALNFSLTGRPSRRKARSFSAISTLTMERERLGAIPPSGALAWTLSPGCVDDRSVTTPETGATI